ncbi:MAG: response regulator [Candidatus Hodarchaeales archaeon]
MRGISVLHVDDEEMFLELSKEFMENIDPAINIEPVNSAINAISLIKEGKKFDVIVSDYSMPGIDGIELLTILRENNHNIPYIIFTGKGRKEVVIKALNLGADFYLQKNSDYDLMFTELRHLIKLAAERNRQKILRRKAEIALRRLEKEKKNILNTLQELVVFQDLNMKIQWANAAACKSVNKNVDQLLGEYCYVIWQNLEVPCEGCPVALTLKTLQPQEAKTVSTDGRHWFIRSSPIFDEEGSIRGVVETILEITEKEKALELVDVIYEMIENATIAIGLYYKEGNVIYANSPFCKITGRTRDEITYLELSDIFPDEIVKKINATGIWKGDSSVINYKQGKQTPCCMHVERIKDSFTIIIITQKEDGKKGPVVN